jgi:hypothetical protein
MTTSTGQHLRNFCCARYSKLLRPLAANGQTHWREVLQKAHRNMSPGEYLCIGHKKSWSLYTVCTEAAEQVYRTYSCCSVNSVQHNMIIKHINMYPVFPATASTPASLLLTNTLSVFNFMALSFAHNISWCAPLSFKALPFPHAFLIAYWTSKLKSNADKAFLASDCSIKCTR